MGRAAGTGASDRSEEAGTASTLTVSGLSGETALRLIALARDAGPRGLIHLASGERRADQLVRTARGLAPDLDIVLFPPWDCLPYDRAAPSRDAMGRRIAVLHALGKAARGPRLVVTTADAVLQRVPPREVWAEAQVALAVGQALDSEAFQAELERLGYRLDERVDEVGEAAIRGRIVDLFPGGAAAPVRIEHEEGRVVALHGYDPATQLTTGDLDMVRILPVSECVPARDAEAFERFAGIEHWLPDHYPRLDTLLDTLPDAALSLGIAAEERLDAALGQILDAYESRTRLRPERAAGRRPPQPKRLYLDREEWDARLRERPVTRFLADEDAGPVRPAPAFAATARPFLRLSAFVREELDAGRRVALAAPSERDLKQLARRVGGELDLDPERVRDWAAIAAAAPGSLVAVRLDLERGFTDPEAGVTLVAAADVLGSRARSARAGPVQPVAIAGTEIEFRLGDAVIHRDHGLGVLRGIESVEAEGASADVIRLDYANDATLMVPANEMGKVWRYGAASDAVSLDRLDGDAWEKRRAKVEAEVAESAVRLVAVVRERQALAAPKLVPPRAAYERFVARFPFSETGDQLAAIEDVLRDLASGRPMNRLVCGDVGFGKTEVALRAAAAAALAGKQVAVVAPTTVLVRQHVKTFERRFAGLGLKVAHLSRLVAPAEAKAVKAGLADGSVQVVIGTHALVAKGIRFHDLGLVAIDEEQRFGAAHKARLRALGEGVHVLTLTATPIPRTLQSALVGLQDISVIATPPAQRQPIRTFLVPFDEATVREALLRERERGGQSFVVCPRVEDIGPMSARLKQLVPELEVLAAHGQMPVEAIDDAMVRFADGEGDVLLATNIIESGLDVPCANTMLVWRADRFGLSQLHQLRGRVGRGRVRGVAYLLTDPASTLPRATRKRLQTLETLDRLGAGFAISARDLDQRGAGDLLGEEQAGHLNLIGLGLYQHLLGRAMAEARGEAPAEEWEPELNLGATGGIPAEYVPEAEVRINLYARVAGLDSAEAIDGLAEEIEDRFGDPPAPVERLLAIARIRHLCREAGVARADAGPQAIAATFRSDRTGDPSIRRAVDAANGALAWRGERLVWTKPGEDESDRLRNVSRLLKRLARP
ncbi:MAG TPA: TRCF domain-containing protein [Microvirga sp.]|jgi:transcription-repair coupling factor (superfamily II helicase)|nr:TRCF domain-containing protein [Microvirga sp.]